MTSLQQQLDTNIDELCNEMSKLQNGKQSSSDTRDVQDRTEREQLQQAYRREVTNLRNDNSTLKKQAAHDGKRINQLNREVFDLKNKMVQGSTKLKRVMEESAKKDRVHTNDSTFFMQLSMELDKLKEEKEQLTASQKNAHKQIQAAQDFLNSAGAILVDTTDDIEVSVRRTRDKEQLHDALHDKAVLEARVENFEEEIKNAQEALKKATAIDLS